MTKINIIQTIKNQEMDRKEFLKYGGIVLLGIVGLKGVASLLTSSNEHPIVGLVEKSESHGFGGGKYGA